MNQEPACQDPAPMTADEAIALLHATEKLRMKERDEAVAKLAASHAREEALLTQFAEAIERGAEREQLREIADLELRKRIAVAEQLAEALEAITPVLKIQIPPKLGQWNWPMLAKIGADALAAYRALNPKPVAAPPPVEK